jgi:ribonuclease P protein component
MLDVFCYGFVGACCPGPKPTDSLHFPVQVIRNETYISTEQNQACPPARFSRPHGHRIGSGHHQCPPGQGPQTSGSDQQQLIDAVPGQQGFTRSMRLVKGAQFKRVFDQRRVHGNQLFRIHFAPAESARLGIAVSRRVSARAVDRNRIRRQIRESFRLQRPALEAMDYVVLARPAAATASNAELRDALNQLWQRLI